MTNQEILEEAIQKAIDNGWLAGVSKFNVITCSVIAPPDVTEPVSLCFANPDGTGDFRWDYRLFIYTQDFAKALWGEYRFDDKPSNAQIRCIKDGEYKNYAEPWKTHLQQMVIAKDSIKYLGEHLND